MVVEPAYFATLHSSLSDPSRHYFQSHVPFPQSGVDVMDPLCVTLRGNVVRHLLLKDHSWSIVSILARYLNCLRYLKV